MLPQEVAQLTGKTGETVILEVEKGAIRKFADATDNSNPLYWDEEYARNTRFGGTIAPPGFFGWPVKWDNPMPFHSELRAEVSDILSRAGYSRTLDGGIDYDFYLTVRSGDILSAMPKVQDVYERESKAGKMLFAVIETTYVNQNSDIVAKARQTVIHR